MAKRYKVQRLDVGIICNVIMETERRRTERNLSHIGLSGSYKWLTFDHGKVGQEFLAMSILADFLGVTKTGLKMYGNNVCTFGKTPAATVYKSRKAFKEEFLRVLAEPTFPPLICDSFEITAEEISKWLALQH